MFRLFNSIICFSNASVRDAFSFSSVPATLRTDAISSTTASSSGLGVAEVAFFIFLAEEHTPVI